MDYLSKQKISDEDAEKIVAIVFEDENVDLFRNEFNSLAQETCDRISNIPNKELISLANILIKGIIEDL